MMVLSDLKKTSHNEKQRFFQTPQHTENRRRKNISLFMKGAIYWLHMHLSISVHLEHKGPSVHATGSNGGNKHILAAAAAK